MRASPVVNGTNPNDAVNWSQLLGQGFAHIVGGKQIFSQASAPTADQAPLGMLNAYDIWIDASAVTHTYKSGSWVAASDATSTTTTPTPPVTPTPLVDTDDSADINAAIDEFFAEYVDSSGRVIHNDESTTKVTSESTSYGLLMAVLQQNQTRYDLIIGWAEINLRRSVLSETRGTSLHAWHYEIGTGVVDRNWSTDAEMVFAIAIAQACQLWGRQVDYDRLKALHDDIKAYCLNMDENRAYPTSDSFQQQVTSNDGHKGHHADGGGVIWETNLSYNIPLAARVLKVFSADPVWDQMLSGIFDIQRKATDNSGDLATTTGLPPDWCAYSTNTHHVSSITNGSNGWTYTRATTYSYDAFRNPVWMAVDALYYPSDTRAVTWLGGNFKSWSISTWATTNKFVDSFNHDGTTSSSTQKLHMAYASYLALIAVNSADATAASIKSSWLTNIKVTGGALGTYFKDSPTSTASSYYGNAWMIFARAIDAGLFAKLTQVAGITGKYSSASGGGTVPISGSVELWTDPNSLIAAHQNTSGDFPTETARTRAAWLAGIPQTLWTGPDWDASGSIVSKAVADATSKQQWLSIAMYGIPDRDLSGPSAGGSPGAAAYRSWVKAVCTAIGSANAIIIFEPDSIPQILQAFQNGTRTKDDYDARLSLMQEAIVTIRNSCPQVRIYVDSGHSAWFPDPSALIAPLQQCHIENAHGISCNVSNFRPLGEVQPWANRILSKLNLGYLGYVVDTSRAGGNPPDGADWENPSGRQFGMLPQFGGDINNDSKLHGVLWVKRPGESDGNAANGVTPNGHGGPSAGQWFPTYLWAPGVADNASGAGMLQRPPTPGVSGST